MDARQQVTNRQRRDTRVQDWCQADALLQLPPVHKKTRTFHKHMTSLHFSHCAVCAESFPNTHTHACLCGMNVGVPREEYACRCAYTCVNSCSTCCMSQLQARPTMPCIRLAIKVACMWLHWCNIWPWTVVVPFTMLYLVPILWLPSMGQTRGNSECAWYRGWSIP